MHIILTGAAGIVGSHTLKYLLARGHSVDAIDIVPIAPTVLDAIPKEASERLRTHVADLVDLSKFEAIVKAAGHVDGVIHNGGIPNPLNNDPRVVYNTNVTSNYNVLQTCAKYGIFRIAQASSVNAYGMSFTPEGHKFWDELPMNEQSPARPEDPYATSKIACEEQANAICRFYNGMRIASLRYHACWPDYETATQCARYQSLFGWVSLESCASAALAAITSEGWDKHEVFNLVAPEICWEGGKDPESRFNGEMLDSLALLEANWQGRYSGVDKSWWASNPRRGFWDCTKAERLLQWKHEG